MGTCILRKSVSSVSAALEPEATGELWPQKQRISQETGQRPNSQAGPGCPPQEHSSCVTPLISCH